MRGHPVAPPLGRARDRPVSLAAPCPEAACSTFDRVLDLDLVACTPLGDPGDNHDVARPERPGLSRIDRATRPVRRVTVGSIPRSRAMMMPAAAPMVRRRRRARSTSMPRSSRAAWREEISWPALPLRTTHQDTVTSAPSPVPSSPG
jgi:hypothetical protein